MKYDKELSEDEKRKIFLREKLRFRIYCTDCNRMSPYVNSPRPCPECGSSAVVCNREVGEIEKTSPVPKFLRNIPLPEGVGEKEVKKKVNALAGVFGKPDMARIAAGFRLLSKGYTPDISRDERGEEF